ncbi:MAG TPA: Vms1/Ankzf1 family peptidyl-tRNA hydrolase [Vicinamibacterales bacterium]|nr:Vms1/Ankzf1 family peptidyl-tRNA hydrolase [Vicinamibacterales bacterium]
MPPTGTPIATLAAELDRLARFEPVTLPVISLYVDLRADHHGKDHFLPLVKKDLHGRARTYPLRSQARESFDRDVERIMQYLDDDVPASAEGLAVFACSGAGEFFEPLLLDAAVPHRLSVSSEPHLYPLARLLDQHPTHAVVLADSHAARLFVFAGGHTLRRETVAGEKINRTSAGGWSQMRYQRHTEKLQADHARELVEALDRVVRQENIDHIVLAGDEVNIPLVKGALSKELAGKVIDILRLEVRTPEQEVMAAAAEALRRHDARTDAEVVERVLDDYRAGGLGVAGPEETLEALGNGQVDELLLAGDALAADAGVTSDELVGRARQTSARIRIIEDAALLADVGGVAAALRYRLDPPPARPSQERV